VADGSAFARSTPAEVVLRMLELRFPAAPRPPTSADLAAFQQDALQRLRSIMAEYGGAFLCDSVGLGKTHVAGSMIRDALSARRAVLVSGPAQLAGHWRRHLRGVRHWAWLSHSACSRGRTWNGSGLRPLVVVDEAHAFRNPATRRYRALAVTCAHADVLLLTATPVNNALVDFYHLIRLFARDDAFAAIGVPDLATAFAAAAAGHEVALVRRVAEAVVVRRTRALVHRYYGRSGGGDSTLRFPDSGPVRMIRYELGSDTAFRDVLRPSLLGLGFPAHRAGGNAAPPELMRLGLLKRLASSAAAFRASLFRHAALLQQFTRAARAGFLLDPHDHRTLFREVDGALQLPLDAIALPRWPAHLDRDAFIADAAADTELLRGMMEATPEPAADPKLQTLRQLLLEEEVRAEPVLIFTEFRDTATSLWRALVAGGGVGLVHGGDARVGRGRGTRQAVVERFAPRANRAPQPPAHQRVRILIATDVLAEGMNLQDARTVVSYDVPWNPVRLAQRIGRIDRLGSPHAYVIACAFTPARDLDDMLGLIGRIRRKLRAIRLVGGDAPRFTAHDERSRRSAARSQPARGLAAEIDRAAELGEALRMELAVRSGGVASIVPPGSPIVPAHPAGGAPNGRVPVACLRTGRDSRRGAVVCLRAGGTTWIVLLLDGEPPRVGGSQPDELLLDALHIVEAPDPDLEAARQRAVRARHAVRQLLRFEQPARPARESQLAARAVGEWLRTRPGGPDPAEITQAEQILAGLAHGSAADGFRIAAALRGGGPAEQVVRRLLAAVPQPSGAGPPRERRGRSPLQVRAVLLLEPALDRPSG
jgi:superfamily II DNA or RNA helicase